MNKCDLIHRNNWTRMNVTYISYAYDVLSIFPNLHFKCGNKYLLLYLHNM